MRALTRPASSPSGLIVRRIPSYGRRHSEGSIARRALLEARLRPAFGASRRRRATRRCLYAPYTVPLLSSGGTDPANRPLVLSPARRHRRWAPPDLVRLRNCGDALAAVRRMWRSGCKGLKGRGWVARQIPPSDGIRHWTPPSATYFEAFATRIDGFCPLTGFAVSSRRKCRSKTPDDAPRTLRHCSQAWRLLRCSRRCYSGAQRLARHVVDVCRTHHRAASGIWRCVVPTRQAFAAAKAQGITSCRLVQTWLQQLVPGVRGLCCVARACRCVSRVCRWVFSPRRVPRCAAPHVECKGRRQSCRLAASSVAVGGGTPLRLARAGSCVLDKLTSFLGRVLKDLAVCLGQGGGGGKGEPPRRRPASPPGSIGVHGGRAAGTASRAGQGGTPLRLPPAAFRVLDKLNSSLRGSWQLGQFVAARGARAKAEPARRRCTAGWRQSVAAGAGGTPLRLPRPPHAFRTNCPLFLEGSWKPQFVAARGTRATGRGCDRGGARPLHDGATTARGAPPSCRLHKGDTLARSADASRARHASLCTATPLDKLPCFLSEMVIERSACQPGGSIDARKPCLFPARSLGRKSPLARPRAHGGGVAPPSGDLAQQHRVGGEHASLRVAPPLDKLLCFLCEMVKKHPVCPPEGAAMQIVPLLGCLLGSLLRRDRARTAAPWHPPACVRDAARAANVFGVQRKLLCGGLQGSVAALEKPAMPWRIPSAPLPSTWRVKELGQTVQPRGVLGRG